LRSTLLLVRREQQLVAAGSGDISALKAHNREPAEDDRVDNEYEGRPSRVDERTKDLERIALRKAAAAAYTIYILIRPNVLV